MPHKRARCVGAQKERVPMPETKKKIPLLGREAEVADVPIVKSNEPWSEYELEDGSVVKFKSVASSVLRIEGQYNADGTPIYIVLSSPVVIVVSASDKLRKKG
jgi:hypothetical protein